MINRLAALIGEKQQKENRVIKVATIARETGISRQTIHKWLNNDLKDFKAESIEAFCRYFGCTVNDLIVIVEAESTPDSIQN